MTQRQTLLPSAAALALCCAAAFIGSGCRSTPRTAYAPTTLPQAAQTTGQAATTIRETANDISEANTEIQASVPEVAKQTDQIAAGVYRLRVVEDALQKTNTTLAAEAIKANESAIALDKANARIHQLEDKANGLLNTILIGASVAGLALAVVSGIWLRSWQGVVTGLGIFAACTAGMWLIQYRGYVAIGGLIVAGAYAAWCIIAERKVSRDVVRTVEAIKGQVPDFKAIANGIQTSKLTRRIVDKIKGTA